MCVAATAALIGTFAVWGISAAENGGGTPSAVDVRARVGSLRKGRGAEGEYSDSNHPGCPRFIAATATTNVLRVVGHDGDASAPWTVSLTLRDGLIEGDFSAKGGGAALVGHVSLTGDITWSDGGEWRWVRDIRAGPAPHPLRIGYGYAGTTPLDAALVAADDAKCGWKPSDLLMGPCPGNALVPALVPASGAPHPSAEACAAACCALRTCLSWQFRSDVGCLHGGDVRLGMEKDGVTAWCEPSPPHPWIGERLLERSGDAIVVDRRAAACAVAWTEAEKPLRGQCFGLGPQRHSGDAGTDHAWSRASESADLCRRACCAHASDPGFRSGRGACETWQWRADKGCFFGGPATCREVNSEIEFLPFAGRRKVTPGRTYTDQHGAIVLPLQRTRAARRERANE